MKKKLGPGESFRKLGPGEQHGAPAGDPSGPTDLDTEGHTLTDILTKPADGLTGAPTPGHDGITGAPTPGHDGLVSHPRTGGE